MKSLNIEIPEYEDSLDPTRNPDANCKEMDWTIPSSRLKEMKILYKKVCTPVKRKRKPFLYERDISDYPKKEKKREKVKTEPKESNEGSGWEMKEKMALKSEPVKMEPLEEQLVKTEPTDVCQEIGQSSVI